MLKIQILSVGRIKEDYYLEAVAEYIKRLNRFCAVEETVQNEITVGDNLEKEAEKIIPALKGKTVILDKEGVQYSSEDFASLINKLSNETAQITFVIGSSKGLAQKVKKRADYSVSFSHMTLPHSLAKVMLCEQLYRAFSIIAGGKYHK